MKNYTIEITNHPYKKDMIFTNIWAKNAKNAKRFVKYYLCEDSKIKDMIFIKSEK